MKENKIIIIILSIFLFSGLTVYTQENLVKNPSFEKEHNRWPSDWYIRSYMEGENDGEYLYESGNAHSGDKFLTMRAKIKNDMRVYQILEVKPHTVYKISAWIKAENFGQKGVGATISVPDSYASSPDLKNTYGRWEKVEIYGITGEYQRRMPVALRLGGWGGHNTGTASYDDVSVVEVKKHPGSQHVNSFCFSEKHDKDVIDNYFRKAGHKQYQLKDILITIFYAIILFLACILFTLYTIFLKGKIQILDSIISFSLRKLYYIFLALFLIIFYVIFLINPFKITVYDVQFSFLIVLLASGGIATYLYKHNSLTPKNLAKILIILGIALRLCYFIYSDYITRQHDIWGAWSHLEYIKHVADTFTLPSVGIYETYHPPIHYYFSAVIFDISRFFHLDEGLCYRSIELLMVFFSSITLFFIYKILNKIKAGKYVLLIGIALACFLPSLVIMSVYLNNDVTVFMFYTISFYFLLKWVDDRSIKNVIFLAIFTSLAVLTKKSALVLFPVLGIVFIVELIKNRKDFKKILIQGGIFLAIALPLSFLYQIRNYILFQHDLSYAVAPFGITLPSNPFNIFFVDIRELLENPFIGDNPEKNFFFLKMLIQTNLFSVFQFPDQKDIAVIMMALYLINIFILFLNFLLFRKKDLADKGYIFLINFISTFLFYFRMRFYSPYDCTQAFRYIAPFIMISYAYFLGKSITRFSNTKYRVLNFVIVSQFWLFCILSALFILEIGFPY